MTKIRFFFSHGCNPVWTSEADGSIDNGLPEDLAKNAELVQLTQELEEDYTALFENSPKVFEYRGFSNDADKQAFLDKVYKTIELLRRLASDNYSLQIEVNEEEF